MSESLYEKYIVRKPTRAQHRVGETAWTSVKGSMTVPPLMFLEGDTPIQGANQMVEAVWIWQDTAMGVHPAKPPHKHDCDEMFLFMGTNRTDTNDLGAEVEFWLGEGKAADKLVFNTSSLVFVPGGLLHMPIIYKHVSKPFLLVVVGINVGNMKPTKYPLREL